MSTSSAIKPLELGKLFELLIEIAQFSGQARVSRTDQLSLREQEEAARGTLMHFLQEQSGLVGARSRLENLNLKQSPEVRQAEIRETVLATVSAYRESLSRALADWRQGKDALKIHASYGAEVPFEEQVNTWLRRLADIETADLQLGLLAHLGEVGANLRDQAEAAVMEAREASTQLEDQRRQLNDLRAQEASRELSTHFVNLAKSERRKGAMLRAIAGAAVGVALWVTWDSGVSTERGGSWTALSEHLALALLLAGGAAYAARLASSHYTFGQWAKSLQVQLDSFEAFIGVVEEQAARDRMREEFGRRVLGAPPQATEDANPGLTTGQLIQLLTAARTPK
ncbi:hypothetical protein LRP67_17810 [Nocardioides sp. cx-169]|uniref:hypothetical protein n=1 Tax=Nocardioides sp. cx-169 TaxID=2899080 RepID=UPI001E6310AA|nr:hypothetical protein [Nocardioides sp. cx-169]MCD4535948.1 hypothetical protein [Nocardioides sp. cx-169]